MRRLAVIMVIFHSLMIIIFCPLRSEGESSNGSVEQGEIGINDILFAPSSFINAIEDNMMISTYIRTRTKEGDVPEDFNETMDTAERFLAVRVGRLGVTLGWSEETDYNLSEPSILSVDYKYPLPYVQEKITFAVDLKFSTRKLPSLDMRRAILDSGVFSITGLATRDFWTRFILYGGVTGNYIYKDACSEKLTDLWKPVPFVGLSINPFPRYNVHLVSELNRGRVDTSEDPMWTWHLGVSIVF